LGHENLHRAQSVEGSSDRAFGLVFAAVFFLVSLWPLLHREGPRWWALAIAAAFACVALVRPVLLARLNRLWMRLGILLGKVVSPIALAILFFVVFVPLGALLRLRGQDPLRLKRDPGAASYWISRDPPGPPPDSMTNQF